MKHTLGRKREIGGGVGQTTTEHASCQHKYLLKNIQHTSITPKTVFNNFLININFFFFLKHAKYFEASINVTIPVPLLFSTFSVEDVSGTSLLGPWNVSRERMICTGYF